jgi:hypothetical protein
MVLNAAGWFDAWFGASTTDWVRLSAGSAAVVERVASEARAGDEVVASQGFVGVFAARSQVYGFFGTNAVPVRSRTVWFVFSFTEGIETATPTQTIEAIDTVSRLAGVETLEVDDNGIYVYRWNPPGDVSSIVLGAPGTQTALGPVVVALGEPRRPALGTITRKPSSSFAGGVDFYVPAGSYVATVRLQGRGPVLVRVWNESSGREVGSAVVRRAGTEDVRIPFGALIDLPVSLGILRGSGLFRYVAIAPTLHYDVTIRVVVQSTAEVRASWTSVSPVVKL